MSKQDYKQQLLNKLAKGISYTGPALAVLVASASMPALSADADAQEHLQLAAHHGAEGHGEGKAEGEGEAEGKAEGHAEGEREAEGEGEGEGEAEGKSEGGY